MLIGNEKYYVFAVTHHNEHEHSPVCSQGTMKLLKQSLYINLWASSVEAMNTSNVYTVFFSVQIIDLTALSIFLREFIVELLAQSACMLTLGWFKLLYFPSVHLREAREMLCTIFWMFPHIHPFQHYIGTVFCKESMSLSLNMQNSLDHFGFIWYVSVSTMKQEKCLQSHMQGDYSCIHPFYYKRIKPLRPLTWGDISPATACFNLITSCSDIRFCFVGFGSDSSRLT